MFGISSSLPGGVPKVQTPVKTITAQYIAKAVNYPKWERARDAALVLRGEAVVKPTLASLASLFHVSVPLIVKAGHQFDEHNKLNGNGNIDGNGTGTTVLISDAVVDNLITEIGVDRIWRAIDKLTSPELPLRAAK